MRYPTITQKFSLFSKHMSKIVNLAKGRTYSCTCSTDTTITMGSGESQVVVTVVAPQGLFVATDIVGIVSNDDAIIRQMFYSSVVSGSGTGGGGGGNANMAEEYDPTDKKLAVSGYLVNYALQTSDFFAQETGTAAMLASIASE